MLIYDDIYAWEGWGGKLQLASGKCRLQIFDLTKIPAGDLSLMRPMVVIVSDVPESKMSVKSCVNHVATKVSKEFKIDPQRMLLIEYYPAETYGAQDEHVIPEKYEVVDFTWLEDKALHPRWKPLDPSIMQIVKKLKIE
ncbi:hypothetical protein ACFL9U_15325 [Thermodesulfobacteriota bacterium]